MVDEDHRKWILLIDHQEHWRELSARALIEADFSVCASGTYDFSWAEMPTKCKQADLVVLGCAAVGPEEHKLISQILSERRNVIVLCALLPQDVRRALFRSGVTDVEDKPYDAVGVVRRVKSVLRSIESRSRYQAVERQGLQ